MRILASRSARSTSTSREVAAAAPPGPGEQSALLALTLQVGSVVVSTMDMAEVMSAVCLALPPAVGAAGAAFMPTELPALDVLASDQQAALIGEVQRRNSAGPLNYALRSAHPVVTPDLTRVGPPELAALAADSGIFTSVVVPLMAGERRLGGLQLLGDSGRPVGAEHVELIRPLVQAIAARLADVLAFTELNCARSMMRQDPSSLTLPLPGSDGVDRSESAVEPSGRRPEAGLAVMTDPQADPTEVIALVVAPPPSVSSGATSARITPPPGRTPKAPPPSGESARAASAPNSAPANRPLASSSRADSAGPEGSPAGLRPDGQPVQHGRHRSST